MKEKWTVYAKRADFYDIGDKFNIDPVVARVIRNRDIVGYENIDKYLNDTDLSGYDVTLMKDMDKGCLIMMDKIRQGKSIRIVSDYDVDGIMSNYILYDALKYAGADISYEIPDRMLDGYGINERIIEDAYTDGVDTIITCDNGIAAFPAIELAKEYGMTVIVTDHHEVPFDIDDNGEKRYRIVPADAVIDIKQVTCGYPFKEICGATVAYKFIRRLYELMGLGWENEDKYIEMVGLATVCDIMLLQDENRIYVKRALQIIKDTKNIGLKALLTANGLTDRKITAYDFGFVLGPCFNATGRLESAKVGLSLLLCEDEELALREAESIREINTERKSMTEDGTKKAIEIVEGSLKDDNILVVYVPELHESLAGIVAGRLKEKYYRPTLVFTDGNDDLLKGSGRSIEGYNMFEELSKCRELFVKFGGHEMAAGFTIEKDNFEILRKTLLNNQHLSEDDLTYKVHIDVAMPFSYISEKLINDLDKLEPFGNGNQKPLFAQSNLSVINLRLMGKDSQFGRLTLQDESGNRIEAMDFRINYFIESIKMWFGEQECDKMLNGQPNSIRINVAYHPSINVYNGRTYLQIRPDRYQKYTQEE
ncbi:MAG: single-stranded-DNA-specific exonuclease RecJ [Lachnospiraceae bacterium]|nr:single-stranded-DNA-specific exonuclease RecJ [Lachnospiraceae bacterium]